VLTDEVEPDIRAFEVAVNVQLPVLDHVDAALQCGGAVAVDPEATRSASTEDVLAQRRAR